MAYMTHLQHHGRHAQTAMQDQKPDKQTSWSRAAKERVKKINDACFGKKPPTADDGWDFKDAFDGPELPTLLHDAPFCAYDEAPVRPHPTHAAPPPYGAQPMALKTEDIDYAMTARMVLARPTHAPKAPDAGLSQPKPRLRRHASHGPFLHTQYPVPPVPAIPPQFRKVHGSH